MNNLSEYDSISFYTGFPNLETFKATLSYLNPGENDENIRYWRSINVRVDKKKTKGKANKGIVTNLGEEELFCRRKNFFWCYVD